MNRTAVIDRLDRFEGCVPHMYRCTGGEVTIGIGHAVFSVEAAQQLIWLHPETVAADYARVKAADLGKVASFYAPLSTCRMDNGDIHDLCQDDVDSFEAQLKKQLPSWGKYPELAQQALFDMAFNLGLGGLKKFPKMLAAVDAGDWQTASAESKRNGISDERNQEIANLFLQAGG